LSNVIAAGVSTLIDRILSLRRPVRRWVAFAIDILLCFVAAWMAFALRLGVWHANPVALTILGSTALLFWVPIAWYSQVYRNLIRFSGGREFAIFFSACVQLSVPLIVIFGIIQIPGVPRTLAVLQPILFLLVLVLSRLCMRFILVGLVPSVRATGAQRRRVVVYGAGRAGQQLALSLSHERHLALVGFIDDDDRLHGQKVAGITVWHSSHLTTLAQERQVDEVLLAIPSARRTRRREIVEQLQELRIRVRMLPGIGQIIDGQVSVTDLRDVPVEDLLGRDPVEPNELLISRSIFGKRVLVTGAGGSIGTELCRQIMRAGPSQLILVEQSEYALYAIDTELREAVREGDRMPDIVPELADVADRNSVFRIFRRWRPDTVYHAAAYKHVPLVEVNPIAGLRNNIFSTNNCALAAETIGVKRFILISTDKAVRPTNIMGASKRVCELVLQARAKAQSKTLFTMVRFGNVLGSSGSVVPRFKKQIATGGPVTITHRDVTRYFMTIPEAVQLVLQAGSMVTGGEVFVLDMGQPIRIEDLAKVMIKLSGLTVRDLDAPDGDVEIVEVGLRPGEKLYEELLIGENPTTTSHPRIMQAREAMLEWTDLSSALDDMEHALKDGDADASIGILKRLVPEYATELSGIAKPVVAAG
jgi:FlaA1/EpsC-like NDP-sugar epimerase